MKTYVARMNFGPMEIFRTIREARAWAESFGAHGLGCVIKRNGRVVAWHRRATDGDGSRWYKADTSALADVADLNRSDLVYPATEPRD